MVGNILKRFIYVALGTTRLTPQARLIDLCALLCIYYLDSHPNPLQKENLHQIVKKNRPC